MMQPAQAANGENASVPPSPTGATMPDPRMFFFAPNPGSMPTFFPPSMGNGMNTSMFNPMMPFFYQPPMLQDGTLASMPPQQQTSQDDARRMSIPALYGGFPTSSAPYFMPTAGASFPFYPSSEALMPAATAMASTSSSETPRQGAAVTTVPLAAISPLSASAPLPSPTRLIDVFPRGKFPDGRPLPRRQTSDLGISHLTLNSGSAHGQNKATKTYIVRRRARSDGVQSAPTKSGPKRAQKSKTVPQPSVMPAPSNATAQLAASPEGLSTLHDMLSHLQPDAFKSTYIEIMRRQGRVLEAQHPIKIKGQLVDLYQLFHAVMWRGGQVKVMERQGWPEIAHLVLDVSAEVAASTPVTRDIEKAYTRSLSTYEDAWARALLCRRDKYIAAKEAGTGVAPAYVSMADSAKLARSKSDGAALKRPAHERRPSDSTAAGVSAMMALAAGSSKPESPQQSTSKEEEGSPRGPKRQRTRSGSGDSNGTDGAKLSPPLAPAVVVDTAQLEASTSSASWASGLTGNLMSYSFADWSSVATPPSSGSALSSFDNHEHTTLAPPQAAQSSAAATTLSSCEVTGFFAPSPDCAGAAAAVGSVISTSDPVGLLAPSSKAAALFSSASIFPSMTPTSSFLDVTGGNPPASSFAHSAAAQAGWGMFDFAPATAARPNTSMASPAQSSGTPAPLPLGFDWEAALPEGSWDLTREQH